MEQFIPPPPPPPSSVSSSSCSSSPTTTTSMTSFTTFDRLSTTAETTLFGCISLALGKFLHSSRSRRRRRLPPTYPSDHHLNKIDHQFQESTLGGLMMNVSPSASASSYLNDNNGGSNTTTPNIVARLMGLDSIPETTDSPTTDNDPRNGRFTRSRSKSMSSPVGWRVEEAEAVNETKIEGSRRGTRTSFSLRETPGFFELEEDDDFLVLKFENGDSKKKSREKEVKKIREHNNVGRSSRRLVERDSGWCQSMESVPGFFVSSLYEEEQGRRPSLKIPQIISPVMLVNHQKTNLDGNAAGRNRSNRRRRRRKKKRRSENWLLDLKMEMHESDDTENSSPVSVLDQSEFDHEVITSEDDKRKNDDLSPRRKLLSELWRMEKSSSTECNGDNSDSTSLLSPEEEEANAAREAIEIETKEPAATAGLAKKEYHKLQNIDMLNRVCKLAEMDLQSSNNWNFSNKRLGSRIITCWEDEIGIELGLQIEDELMDELVNQLV